MTSWLGGAALLALAAGPALAQAPAAPAAVPVLTTGVLAALCGANAADADGATAIGYCRGFIVGVGQYHVEISRAGGIRPAFCLPNPTPSLEFVQTSFVAWVAANPQHAGDRAVDGLLRWASTAYPCAAPAGRRAAPR
ncbi:MAG: hypothetical protein K5Q68_13930 [Roseococcus sp.]|nr:hypothetical protein [Roseococcus sp.]